MMIQRQNYQSYFFLVVSNVSKIKTNMPARIEKIAESVTEPSEFGWMFMSPGQEDYSNVYLAQSTTNDYEHLNQLKVLSLENTSNGDR